MHREQLNRALRKHRLPAALSHYQALESLEPDEPRWPHRRGELLERMGERGPALVALERAVTLYAERGFLARAVAMAKLIVGLEPDRTDILERIDPESARVLQRRRRRAALLGPSSPATSNQGLPRLDPNAYQPLKRADDAGDDELRFEDEGSIELELSDIELVERTSIVDPLPRPSESESPALSEFVLVEETVEPSAEQLAKLPGLPLFADLPKDALAELMRLSELVHLDNGEVVVRRGAPADGLFVIIEGSVRVDVPGLEATADLFLGEGDVFGETSLLDDVKRKADVRVHGRLVALQIPKATLDGLVGRYPNVGDVLFELLTRRIVGNLLQTSPLFTAFDVDTRRDIGRMFEARRADEGSVLIEAGKRSDGLYVLLVGQLELDLATGETRVLSPVTVLGQDALMTHNTVDYCARTLSDALVLRLPAGQFGRLAALYPPVVAQLAELSAKGRRGPQYL